MIIKTKIACVDLFCGAGGLTHGFGNAVPIDLSRAMARSIKFWR